MVKNIISKVAKKEETIDLQKIIGENFSAIKDYGNKEGYPVNIGVVYDADNDYALADISNKEEEVVVCSSFVSKNDNKKRMIAALKSEINFLV